MRFASIVLLLLVSCTHAGTPLEICNFECFCAGEENVQSKEIFCDGRKLEPHLAGEAIIKEIGKDVSD